VDGVDGACRARGAGEQPYNVRPAGRAIRVGLPIGRAD